MRAVIATFIAVFLALIASPVAAQSIDQANIDCLAKGMYHEARAESVEGIKAVGYVILNRTEDPHFSGNPCGVIYQTGQFSNMRAAKVTDQKTYAKVRSIAEEVYNSPQRDNTHGAKYFHNKRVHPKWGKKMRTAQYGNHIFYK